MAKSLRSTILTAAPAVVLVAAAALGWAALQTSGARVQASTAARGMFSSGTVTLELTGGPQRILFDADGLYPGRSVQGCVELAYRGSLPAELRVFGELVASDGLERFIHLEAGLAATCRDDAARTTAYVGRLDHLLAERSTYATGIVLGNERVRADTPLALWAEATLARDDAAQDRSVAFTFVAEARP